MGLLLHFWDPISSNLIIKDLRQRLLHFEPSDREAIRD